MSRAITAYFRGARQRAAGEHSGARYRDPAPAGLPRPRLRDYLRLRPYGERLLTPAAATWLGSARVVILLMAGIEGFVWGAVGLSMVPQDSAWLGPPVALFLFVLMFSVIWIIDASLMMSERPRLRRGAGGPEAGPGPLLRWIAGLLVRLAIVGVSLYVTAPFVEKLIRADDIAAWHQARVERYYDERAERLQRQIETHAGTLDDGVRARAASLERQIERLEGELESIRQQRERIEAEYQPEIEVLTRDLAQARARVGDEILGRNERPEGYGPEARKWDARAERLAEALDARQTQLAARLEPLAQEAEQHQQRLQALQGELRAVRAEEQQLLERIRAEVEAEQPQAQPPQLTFAARSKALEALRQRPDEREVPHFETVAGFAQAALGILFAALIALKLFEPPAVRAYFSESVQYRYWQYRNGGLAHIPGFQDHDDPMRRLSPSEFAQRWQHWEEDPQAFVAERRARLEAEARLARLDGDQRYEEELSRQRLAGVGQQLEHEQRQREIELEARERELRLRLAHLDRRLTDENATQRQRDTLQLEHERRAESERRAETAQARREERLASLRARLEQAREGITAADERLADLERQRAENADALVRARGEIARAQEHSERLQAERDRATAAQDDGGGKAERATGLAAGWIRARRSAHRRRLRRTRERLERSLAAAQRSLDDARARAAVLELEQQRLGAALADTGAERAQARQERDDCRAAIDTLLLAPPEAAAPPASGAATTA